jgi:HK97 family phage major capsid protein
VATGTTTAAVADLGSPSNTAMTTSSVSAGVKTYAGQQKFALQLLDQSPINMDEVVFADLLADHAVKTDTAVINGGGGSAHSGALGTGSIVAVTYTDASPTVGELYPKIADAVQQIHTGRFLPPQAIVMHPRRWGWFLAALDANGRPLVVPSAQGPQNAFAGMTDVRSEGSVGTLMGLPVYTDANVPTTLGGGTEDRVIVARFDDLYFWEGAMRMRTLFETDADTLEVRLQVWNYQAFLAARYPKSIAVVSGTGLAAPTF